MAYVRGGQLHHHPTPTSPNNEYTGITSAAVIPVTVFSEGIGDMGFLGHCNTGECETVDLRYTCVSFFVVVFPF